MFKVMIAEDEPPIARTVKTALEAADADFKVEKCCINGRMAVEALLKEDFDIVITDIKMPVMNGIELAGWISENKPDTITVILSGYSDFEYARKALEYKVFDYLLKPVSKEKIYELTARIKAEQGRKKTEDAKNDGEENTAIVLACAGSYLLYGSEVMMPGENFWTDDKIEDFMSRNLGPNDGYISFNNNLPSERFLVIESETAAQQEEIITRFYDSMKICDLPITIVYKKGVRMKNTGRSLPALREQLIKRLIPGKSQLICCNDISDSFENLERPYGKGDIDAIIISIKNGDNAEVRMRLKKMFDAMRNADCTQEEYNGLLNIILDTYVLNYPENQQRKNTSVKHEFINALAGFVSFGSLIDDITSILMSLKRDTKNKDRYVQLADSVEAYLIKNYNKSVTNDVLSREFGFVPSYIARIFKRQKGVSPNEYITKYRIELAKQLIENNPDMKIKEIADAVGFKESYYFSKTFKKETGIWPTEYHS
ncbi:MAG: response regulator [Clostridiales bacterium]|nr:response regulator [Clostridiales bacterium]